MKPLFPGTHGVEETAPPAHLFRASRTAAALLLMWTTERAAAPQVAASTATSTAGPPSTASGSEARLYRRPPLAPAAEWPRTLRELEPIVAANTPLFYFHPSERCAPRSLCTVLVRWGWFGGVGSSCARRLMQPPAAEHEGAGAEGRWRGGPRGHPAGHAHMHCAALSSDGRHSHWTHSSAGVRVPVEEGLHRVPAARRHVWRPGLGGAGGGPR